MSKNIILAATLLTLFSHTHSMSWKEHISTFYQQSISPILSKVGSYIMPQWLQERPAGQQAAMLGTAGGICILGYCFLKNYFSSKLEQHLKQIEDYIDTPGAFVLIGKTKTGDYVLESHFPSMKKPFKKNLTQNEKVSITKYLKKLSSNKNHNTKNSRII